MRFQYKLTVLFFKPVYSAKHSEKYYRHLRFQYKLTLCCFLNLCIVLSILRYYYRLFRNVRDLYTT